MEEKRTAAEHRIEFEERKCGYVTGVTEVPSFDEQKIMLTTSAGRMAIKGDKLHIKQLNLEKGDVEIEGRIDTLEYLSQSKENKPDSVWKRILR